MTAPLLFIANPDAGSAGGDAVDRAAAALAAHATVTVALTRTTEEVRAALASHPSHGVVLAGGDGSVHVGVNALHALAPERLAGAPLGIIPLGTGNDLAGALELPEDLDEAAAVAATGAPRQLDLIRGPQGRIVVNAAHIGVGALAAERGEALKPGLGPLAYRAGALAAGLGNPAWDVRVEVDGALLHEGRAVFAACAVSPRMGGGVRAVPDAAPGDGSLHVVVIEAFDDLAEAVGIGRLVMAGEHLDDPRVHHARGRRVRVSGEAAVHDIDGELTDPLDEAEYELLPRAWSVRVPPD